MKNSKGKHQHNFTEQTTQAILNQYRRKGKIHHANEPLRHTQKASQVLTEQKSFATQAIPKQIYRAGKPHRQY